MGDSVLLTSAGSCRLSVGFRDCLARCEQKKRSIYALLIASFSLLSFLSSAFIAGMIV